MAETKSHGVTAEQRLTERILRLIGSDGGPLGAGTVYFHLRAEGLGVSAPTIGRRLRELEMRGLLRKVGVEGRELTAAGRRTLASMEREARLQQAGQAVLGALRSGRENDVVDLLVARRPIEREAARLAAERATGRDIAAMEAALRAQQSEVERGDLAVDADIRFHECVSRASGNPFLAALVSLLRHHGQYSYLITKARALAGHGRVIDHHAVLAAIVARDPARAEQAMDDHIGQLIDEVRAYGELAQAKERDGSGTRVSRPSRRGTSLAAQIHY